LHWEFHGPIMTDASGAVAADGGNGSGHVPVLGLIFMTCADPGQNPRRSASPSLEKSPARVACDLTEVTRMNWMWVNIPLMAAFFLAVAGIPLWLVLRRPDFSGQPGVGGLQAEVHVQRLVDLRQQGRREMSDRPADALNGDGSDLLRLRLGVPAEAGHAAR
jgi:hypothetical protein